MPERAGVPDWVLVCTDGVELPCHGVFLSVISTVLAGIGDTARRAGGRIRVPFPHDCVIGELFLEWVYWHSMPNDMTVEEAKILGGLSSEWDIPGTAPLLTFCLPYSHA